MLSQIRQCFSRDFFVVEMKNLAADDLIVFMTLAGNQNQIISAGLCDCPVNCFTTISNFFIRLSGRLNSLFRIGKNLICIFGAGIV